MSDIALNKVSEIAHFSPDYLEMIDHIKDVMPLALRDSQNFYKASSQFKTVTLDITDMTPISSIKHCLAAIDQTKVALEEAHIKLRKNEIDMKRKKQKWETESDPLAKEMLEVEMMEISTHGTNIHNAVKGAVRKLSFLVTQYKALMANIGKTELTEAEFEAEENKYHIMTALKQALNAARARGGVIDEGNHIYLFDMGINGAVAQREISEYLQVEAEVIAQGLEPTHSMTVKWLEKCAEKFMDCGIVYAKSRGFVPLDDLSLVKEIEQ